MYLPLVSCIMPTHNRRQFLPLAIENFFKQDYPNLELIIDDDSDDSCIDLIPTSPIIKYYYSKNSRSVGIKRNFTCEKASGEIIVHWDDDDWYATDWVTRQVNELMYTNADICGINQINFYILGLNKSWQYTDSENATPWIYGATLAYWKSFWKKHPFKDIQAGEDNDFIWNNNAILHIYKYTEGYIGFIHPDNIAMAPFDNPRKKIQVIKWMKIMEEPEKIPPTYYRYNISDPLVTCIMPTTNRRKFIPKAIEYFQKQNYANRELVIIDDSSQPISDLIPICENIKYFHSGKQDDIGTKRNRACEIASGSIIIHWDDDDWYATDWISKQVNTLQNNNIDICGLNQVQFYSVLDNKYWMTKNMNSRKLWLSGATLAYKKSFWKQHKFKSLQIGEDDDFVRNNNAKIFAHDYYQGFIAIIHQKNTSIKVFQSKK